MDEMDYIELFSKTPISDLLVKNQTLIAVYKTSTVRDTLSVLYTHSISSVPVVENDTSGKNRVLGFVDTNDILALLIKYTAKTEMGSMDLKLISMAFLDTQIFGVMDLSKRDHFNVILSDSSIFELLRTISGGIHRIAILSPFTDIEDIITQSNVIDFIAKNIELLGGIGEMTIRDLKHQLLLIDSDAMVVALESDILLDTFALMNSRKVSAVPIINSQHQIVGNLSVNDLSSVNNDNFGILLQSTDKFISRNEMVDQHKHKPSYPIVVHEGDKFKTAIEMLSKYRVHRIWVVDESRKPISILSLSNICKILTNPPTQLSS